MNEKAYRAALDSIGAALDAAYALLPDEDEDAQPEPALAAALAASRVVVACKHRRREPMGGFGSAVGWICPDCGATGTGG